MSNSRPSASAAPPDAASPSCIKAGRHKGAHAPMGSDAHAARKRSAHDTAVLFYYSYSFLIFVDVCLFVWHFIMFGKAWYDKSESDLLELMFATTHFLTNTIAIADLFIHLMSFINNKETCEFESTKSTNCFMYSTIGMYADIVAVALNNVAAGSHGWYSVALYWTMAGQSALSALLSIAVYYWGVKLSRYCVLHTATERGVSITKGPDDLYNKLVM